MAYFANHVRPEYHQRQQMNALDPFHPFLQAIFAQLQEPEEAQRPQKQQQSSPAATGCQKKPAAAPTAASATMRGAACEPRFKPTPKNCNRSNTAFTPRFDVFETADAFHIEGGLPGLSDKKTISIEFSDERTMLISGRTGRTVAKATASPATKQIEEEQRQAQPMQKRRSLNPTVEDTDDEDDFSVVSATSPSKKAEESSNEDQEPPRKVWLSERTYGDFRRTFSFPSPVDIENVSARLENGLLTIVVPKVMFAGVRKIEIE